MLRNARTAYTGAQNAGRLEGMRQAEKLGVDVKKRWMATLDSRTRDAHADLDGQVQDRDKPFKSPLGDIMFPGDPTAKPGNVYNCRCTITYVYPEYAAAMTRRDNESGEIIRDMTYQEWEAMKALTAARDSSIMASDSGKIWYSITRELIKGDDYDEYGFSRYRAMRAIGLLTFESDDDFLRGAAEYGVHYTARRYCFFYGNRKKI